MTDKQKQAIRDMRQQGLSHAAIADALRLSPNTVKSFCRREKLSGNYDDENKNRCKNCGSPLKHSSGSKKKVFCCNQCRYTWWNRHRKYMEREYRLSCIGCGSDFAASSKHRKYCGRECYLRSRHGEGLP